MIEIISKLSATLKSSSLPLFLITVFDSTWRLKIKEKDLRMEDRVPGDNFPYIVISQGQD